MCNYICTIIKKKTMKKLFIILLIFTVSCDADIPLAKVSTSIKLHETEKYGGGLIENIDRTGVPSNIWGLKISIENLDHNVLDINNTYSYENTHTIFSDDLKIDGVTEGSNRFIIESIGRGMGTYEIFEEGYDEYSYRDTAITLLSMSDAARLAWHKNTAKDHRHVYSLYRDTVIDYISPNVANLIHANMKCVNGRLCIVIENFKTKVNRKHQLRINIRGKRNIVKKYEYIYYFLNNNIEEKTEVDVSIEVWRKKSNGPFEYQRTIERTLYYEPGKNKLKVLTFR